MMDCLSDNVLNTRALKPWLSVRAILSSMCSEEWEIRCELVELDENVIIWDIVEAWNIGTSEDDTGDTISQDCVEGERNIIVGCGVIASPDCSVPLRTEEEGSAQDERSLLSSVSLVESIPGRSLL